MRLLSQHGRVQTPARAVREGSVAWLAAIGLGVWFVVGFPFGNHNESYYWVARFEQEGAWYIAWTSRLAATFRPGGQGLAYIGWRVSGGESWPVQLFNFALAACALWGTALAVGATRTFALAAMVVGGAFVTGYVYLFHLHGVFYSPVLALIAVLLHLRKAERLTPAQKDLVACGSSLAVGLLFHPYALIVFLGYLAGAGIERWAQFSYRDWLRSGLVGCVAVVALLADRPQWHQALGSDNVRAFLASYRLVEISPAISVLSGVFAAATVLGIGSMGRRPRCVLAVTVLLSSALAVVGGVPVTLLWVAAAVFKMAYLREWSLAGMTATTALLPVIATSGSPTYTIFAILMSTVALAWGSVSSEQVLARIGGRWIAVGVLLIGVLTGGVRMGVDVPGVSRLAQPLVAERERTRQLEAVIDWMLGSEYREWHLALEEIANPADAGREAVERRRRPPTYQPYLDAYLAARRTTVGNGHILLVSFGSTRRDDMTLVKTISGRYAGEVRVFK